MLFAEWMALAREYALVMYCWDDFETNDVEVFYLQGSTPKGAVDALAYSFDLDSFSDLHFGHNPPNYDGNKYEIRP